MSAARIILLGAPVGKVPLIVHHIWFSSPLPKTLAKPDDDFERDDIFEKLKDEYNANKDLPNFRLILWTDAPDNVELQKYIDENNLHKIEIKNYNSLKAEPEFEGFDETDKEILEFLHQELTQVAGNAGAASDLFRLLVLKHLGGFYSDINDEPPYIFTANEAFIPSLGCWIGGVSNLACNNLLAAIKNHPLICATLAEIANRYKEHGVQSILDDRADDRYNPIHYSGPIPLQESVAKTFPQFSFYNEEIYQHCLTEEGKQHLQLPQQTFFKAANPHYQTGRGKSWVKSEYKAENAILLFNDEQIAAYRK